VAAPTAVSPEPLAALPIEMIFDYLGVMLDGPAAAGKTITINLDLTDTRQQLRVAFGRHFSRCERGVHGCPTHPKPSKAAHRPPRRPQHPASITIGDHTPKIMLAI
jgi:hypothetical protein